MKAYVHGYSDAEAGRLKDQADTLAGLLHPAKPFPPGSRVLEAGCGVGAQTVILARNSPDAHFLSIDISQESIERARRKVTAQNLSNVTLEVADILDLPYADESFDHLFLLLRSY